MFLNFLRVAQDDMQKLNEVTPMLNMIYDKLKSPGIHPNAEFFSNALHEMERNVRRGIESVEQLITSLNLIQRFLNRRERKGTPAEGEESL